MFFWKKKQKTADRPTWVPAQGGFESSRSRRFIENVLSSLERKRTALRLAQKENQSSPTILLGSTGKYLLIDAPAEWKLRNLAVRIHFKDAADLDCYFDTKVVYIKDEIIYAKMPGTLYRFQRRAHFRVAVPGGSQAVVAGPLAGDGFLVKNISAGGMLCCSTNRQLARGMLLKSIALNLTLAGKQGRNGSRITIPQGRIVRTFDDRDARQFCYGVAFECGASEESSLLAYIRQRELEMAKDEGEFDPAGGNPGEEANHHHSGVRRPA